MNERGKNFLGKLEEFLLREEETDHWPGTIMLGKATLLFYRCEEKVEELLTEPNSIYAWQQPNYPEDLAFYIGDENWFGSIAHEHDAFFGPGYFAIKEIQLHVPGIRVIRRSYDNDNNSV